MSVSRRSFNPAVCWTNEPGPAQRKLAKDLRHSTTYVRVYPKTEKLIVQIKVPRRAGGYETRRFHLEQMGFDPDADPIQFRALVEHLTNDPTLPAELIPLTTARMRNNHYIVVNAEASRKSETADGARASSDSGASATRFDALVGSFFQMSDWWRHGIFERSREAYRDCLKEVRRLVPSIDSLDFRNVCEWDLEDRVEAFRTMNLRLTGARKGADGIPRPIYVEEEAAKKLNRKPTEPDGRHRDALLPRYRLTQWPAFWERICEFAIEQHSLPLHRDVLEAMTLTKSQKKSLRAQSKKPRLGATNLAWTTEQFAAFQKQAGPTLRLSAILMRYQGWRIGDVLQRKWTDFGRDPKGEYRFGTVNFVAAKNGYHFNDYPLRIPVKAALEKHFERFGPHASGCEYVIAHDPSRRGFSASYSDDQLLRAAELLNAREGHVRSGYALATELRQISAADAESSLEEQPLPQGLGVLSRLEFLQSSATRPVWIAYTEDGFRASWKRAVKRACRAGGFDDSAFMMTCHGLRVTGSITIARFMNYSSSDVQAWLGDRSPTMAEYYTSEANRSVRAGELIGVLDDADLAEGADEFLARLKLAPQTSADEERELQALLDEALEEGDIDAARVLSAKLKLLRG